MILDVAGAGEVVVGVGRGHALVRVRLELGEDLLERLAHDVCEHVEPSAVRHTEHDRLDAALHRRVDELLHAHDEHLVSRAVVSRARVSSRAIVGRAMVRAMRTSQPSRPKRLDVGYFVARKVSKWSDLRMGWC